MITYLIAPVLLVVLVLVVMASYLPRITMFLSGVALLPVVFILTQYDHPHVPALAIGIVVFVGVSLVGIFLLALSKVKN